MNGEYDVCGGTRGYGQDECGSFMAGVDYNKELLIAADNGKELMVRRAFGYGATDATGALINAVPKLTPARMKIALQCIENHADVNEALLYAARNDNVRLAIICMDNGATNVKEAYEVALATNKDKESCVAIVIANIM